jgi:hypothetical protein
MSTIALAVVATAFSVGTACMIAHKVGMIKGYEKGHTEGHIKGQQVMFDNISVSLKRAVGEGEYIKLTDKMWGPIITTTPALHKVCPKCGKMEDTKNGG